MESRSGKPPIGILLLLLMGEVIVSGFSLTATTAAYVRSVVTPREWSSRQKLTDINEFFWTPKIAVDRSSVIHIAYTDFQQEQVRFYYTKVDTTTGNVASPILLSDYAVSVVAPALAVDQEGNAHLAWLDGRENRTEIYYAKIPRIPVRVLERRLSSDSTECGEPSVAVDFEGNAHIVWHSKKGEVTVMPIDYELFYCKVDRDGTVAVPEKMITVSDRYYSIKPSLTVDKRNTLHLTWIDNRNAEIRDFHEVLYKKLDNEGQPLSTEIVAGRIPRLVSVDHAPAALVDDLGGVAFVFVDRSPRPGS